jgi:hypothetical protein
VHFLFEKPHRKGVHVTAVHVNGIVKKQKAKSSSPPEVRRRRVQASAAVLMAQEAAAQVKNDVYSALRSAHEQ